ncbi:MAG: hypothetical protein IPJ30_20745 [Acidobacteria bacterium]|nr:hypothetical protein [Acidobacteriota bacterium]
MKSAVAFIVWLLFLTASNVVLGQQSSSIPPDSPRWEFQGQAKVTEYLGRGSIFLNGGAAVLKDLEMRDGVIDVDVATPASRGFFGPQFRITRDGNNGEWVYLRQHKSGQPDAMQYTPILNTGLNWQIYSGQDSRALSKFRKTNGFICGSKSRERRRNFLSKI